MRVRGRAWKLGDHITTDHIIPGRLKYKVRTLEEMRRYVFNDLIPGFSERVRPGDVIVAGRNFGYGSSREHAARLLKLVGVGAVVAESFARIFYRNAINVGLPVVEAVIEAEDGDEMEVDLSGGVVRNLSRGAESRFRPFPPMIMSLLEEDGIEAYFRRHGRFPWE